MQLTGPLALVAALTTTLAAILGIIAIAGGQDGSGTMPFILSVDADHLTFELRNYALTALNQTPNTLEVIVSDPAYAQLYFTTFCSGGGSDSDIFCEKDNSFPTDFSIGQYFAQDEAADGALLPDSQIVGSYSSGFGMAFIGFVENTGSTQPFQPSQELSEKAANLTTEIQTQLSAFSQSDEYVLHMQTAGALLMTASVVMFLACIMALFVVLARGYVSRRSKAIQAVMATIAAACFLAAAAYLSAQIHKVLNAPPPVPTVPTATLELQTSSAFMGIMWAAAGLAITGALLSLSLLFQAPLPAENCPAWRRPEKLRSAELAQGRQIKNSTKHSSAASMAEYRYV